MFEPISQNLSELMMLAVLGFFLGVFYEPLRISRVFIKTNTVLVNIEDFIFLLACSVIIFAYSLEFGGGHFRLFYLVGIAFGATVYFITLGKIISLLIKATKNIIKRAFYCVVRFVKKWIVSPIVTLIRHIAQKITGYTNKISKAYKKQVSLLKSNAKKRYNKRINKRREHLESLHPEKVSGGRINGVSKVRKDFLNETGEPKEKERAKIKARVRIVDR